MMTGLNRESQEVLDLGTAHTLPLTTVTEMPTHGLSLATTTIGKIILSIPQLHFPCLGTIMVLIFTHNNHIMLGLELSQSHLSLIPILPGTDAPDQIAPAIIDSITILTLKLDLLNDILYFCQ